jgi:hypothetical protein
MNRTQTLTDEEAKLIDAYRTFLAWAKPGDTFRWRAHFIRK